MNGNYCIKGAGTLVPLNATEVASPITKALQCNAHQNYSLFTIHYSLTAAQDSPACVPTLEHGNEKMGLKPQPQKSTHYPLPTLKSPTGRSLC